jgi:hypothetical protein
MDQPKGAVIKANRPSLKSLKPWIFAKQYVFAISRPGSQTSGQSTVEIRSSSILRMYAWLPSHFVSQSDLNEAFAEMNRLHTQTQQRKPYTKKKVSGRERKALGHCHHRL